jgi:hypothetical protein
MAASVRAAVEAGEYASTSEGWVGGESRNPPPQRTMGRDMSICWDTRLIHDLSCRDMAGYAFGFNPPTDCYGLLISRSFVQVA